MNYRIGDIVLIVAKKPVKCAAGWCGEMGRYLAQVATITSLHDYGPYYRSIWMTVSFGGQRIALTESSQTFPISKSKSPSTSSVCSGNQTIIW